MMNNIVSKISALSQKQRFTLLLILGLLVLLYISLRNVGKKQEIRPRAAGSGEVDLRLVPNSGTKGKNETFKIELKLHNNRSDIHSISGVEATLLDENNKFSVNNVNSKCLSPFDSELGFVSVSGQRITVICVSKINLNPDLPSPTPPVLSTDDIAFAQIELTVKGDAVEGNAPISFVQTRVTRVGDAKDISTVGQPASFTVQGTGGTTPSPTPTVTGSPSISPTPSPTGNPSACLTFPTTDTFEGATPSAQLWDERTKGNWSLTQSGGVLRASVTSSNEWGQARRITKKVVCDDFDVRVDFSQFTAEQKQTASAILTVEWGGQINSYIYVEMFKDNINQGFRTDYNLNGVWQKPGTWKPASGTSGKLRIKRRAAIVTTYYDDNSGKGWQELYTFTNAPGDDAKIVFGVASSDPDHPSVSANFDNFYLAAVQPDPTFTPIPSRTPTPSISPTPLPPTPPSGEDKYTIDVGDKQYLVFNIGAGQTPLIRFKAKLANTQNNPQLYFRLRVKDELAFLTDPNADSSSDICNSPPPSVKDFAVPMQATDGVYSPVPDIGGPPPAGQTKANVDADGWVSLPGVIAGKYYSIVLKAPKTSGEKMVEHALLQPDKNESQNFDWTANEINPGDLPDPNNGLKQDCTVNSVDLSLITSRLGATDGDSLNIGDVNYDGVINGNDISKVVNTLSTKPDDDL